MPIVTDEEDIPPTCSSKRTVTTLYIKSSTGGSVTELHISQPPKFLIRIYSRLPDRPVVKFIYKI